MTDNPMLSGCVIPSLGRILPAVDTLHLLDPDEPPTILLIQPTRISRSCDRTSRFHTRPNWFPVTGRYRKGCSTSSWGAGRWALRVQA